jgi:transposase InsO family protein
MMMSKQTKLNSFYEDRHFNTLPKCKLCGRDIIKRHCWHHIRARYVTLKNGIKVKQGFTVSLCGQCHFKMHKVYSKDIKKEIEDKWLKEVLDCYADRIESFQEHQFAWDIGTVVV